MRLSPITLATTRKLHAELPAFFLLLAPGYNRDKNCMQNQRLL